MLIIGHRGARGLAPENTIASFQKAIDYGVDQIEFDVRVTKDHIPVLHHNKKLIDQSGNKLALSKHDFNELEGHKPDLITLEQALKIFASKVALVIEVKPGEPTETIAAVIKKFLPSEISINSKNQNTLMELHKLLPSVPKIVIEPWSGIIASWRAKQVPTKKLFMNQHFLWFGIIAAMSHRGYELYAYTLNDTKKARRWAKYGLAGVVTDFPDRFKN